MKNILYGPQTQASIENFPFDYPVVHREFIYAMVMIKKAAAMANEKAGKISKKQSQDIQKACDDILSGKYDNQFIIPALHGGAGTSVNMNVNEVIATLSKTHPNDQVNSSQSTNDVNPSSLKIASILLTRKLLRSLDKLIQAIDQKAKQYQHAPKLARTHMQDAIPTTFGDEFASYRDIIKRDKQRIEDASKYLFELNMGGTAIGDSTNTPETYRKEVYQNLKKVTEINELKPLKNLMSGTSSNTDYYNLSSTITALCLDLSKIATDLRFMSSGPRGGIGEITFLKLQPGSSIMPGKVNPIIAETMNNLYYQVAGNNLTIQLAAEGAHLELAIMLPSIVDSLIIILKIAETGVRIFAEKGLAKIVVNEKKAKEHLENSTAYSTVLTLRLGYDVVSQVVHEAVETGKTLREIILQKKLLSEKEFEKIIKLQK